MKGGRDWWSQIEQTLRAPSLEHLVLVVTDRALERPIIREEMRLARQEGVQVTPVRGSDQLDFTSVPRWLGQVLELDKPEHWHVLVNTLAAPSRQNRVPMMAPEPPLDYVARSTEFDALKRQLIDGRGDAIAITAALKGAGGYGKTTLAKVLAHDADVQTAYFDGVLWVELGENPDNLLDILGDLTTTLTGTRVTFDTVGAASAGFAEVLGARRILLVLDDAWREQDVRPFLEGGPNTTRLVTTRIDRVVPDGAVRQPVDAMTSQEATQLLAWGLPDDQMQAEAGRLKALSERVGEWPLLVKLVNGFLRQRVERAREPLARAIEGVNKRLDAKGFVAFDARNAVDRSKAVAQTMNASLDLLDEGQRARFSELGIFPEDVDIPVGVVERLWARSGGLDEMATEDLIIELADLSLLLSVDLERRIVRLHDVVRHFLRELAREEGLGRYEAQLVDAMADCLEADNTDTPELTFYMPLLLYYSVRARRWDVIVRAFSVPALFATLPPSTYGAAYSPGMFHGRFSGSLLPAHLNDLEASDRMAVGAAIATALASNARTFMHAALGYPRPWAHVAERLRTENEPEFARYRDAFYNFATLAGLSAEWAIAAFTGPTVGGACHTFLEANRDIVDFLDDLRMSGARDTGLSGALEDNLAGPSFDTWTKLQGRQ